MKKKMTLANAAPHPFGGAVLWLDYCKAPYSLLVGKAGTVKALVTSEPDRMPDDRGYVEVVRLIGPVVCVNPDGTPGAVLGDEGDLVRIFRGGLKSVRVHIEPGRYEEYQASQLNEYLPDDWPEDWDEDVAYEE